MNFKASSSLLGFKSARGIFQPVLGIARLRRFDLPFSGFNLAISRRGSALSVIIGDGEIKLPSSAPSEAWDFEGRLPLFCESAFVRYEESFSF
jgi:hypothetical protein